MVCFFAFMIFEDLDYHPIVNYRMKKTPPCSKCAYCDNKYSDYLQCTYPQAIEDYEKVCLRIVDRISASKVRGTNNCKFKAVEEPEPTSEKAEKR